MMCCQIVMLLAAAAALFAQDQAVKSFVGTVAGFRPEAAQVEVRSDHGEVIVGHFTPDSIAQRIGPGAHDLKNAEKISVTDVAIGDRVLVSLAPGSSDILRIVVMSADDIAKRNEADRMGWQKRGVAGVVSAKSGHQITIKQKTMTGDVEVVVTTDEQTAFKRYALDSVKFSDARPAKPADIAVGDQLRARGTKSENGRNIAAQDVVFGTFVVKAGVVTTVNPESKEIVLKELGTNKLLHVRLTADSQMKLMPSMPIGNGMPGGPGGGPGGNPLARGMPNGPPGNLDINRMLEDMPDAKLEQLKPGSTVVVSSTKPDGAEQLTAIMLLGNADPLIQMARMTSGSFAPGVAPNAGLSGPMDLSGLGLTGIIMQ